jgi:hypothetical protein
MQIARQRRQGLAVRGRVFALVLVSVLRCVASSDAAPIAKADKAAIDAAVADLKKEFVAHQRDPKSPLRTTCDYFKEKPPIALDAVFAALEQRLDSDPGVAAYARWQLLSAFPKEIAAANLSQAIEIYRQAPRPSARYGLSEKEQASLDGWLSSAKKTDDVVLTIRLESAVKVWSEQNRHIIAYRDEWYRRLPKTAVTFAAAFQDAFERQNLAAGADDFAPLVIADVSNWMTVGDADAAKCGALAQLLAKLRDKPAPPYYASAAIRSGKLMWVKKTDSMDPRKKLTHLHQALIEAAQKRK